MAEGEVGAVAPVVNAPVTAEVVTTAPDATAAPVVEKEPEEKLLPQSEVNKLIQKRERIAESRALKIARAEARAELAEKQLAERSQASQPAGEPKPEDYREKTPQEFMRDWLKWERQQQQDSSASTERQTREVELRRQEAEYVQTKLAEASEKFPDLPDRLDSLPALSRPMLEFVMEEEHGPAVGDYIANNVAEALRIAKLSPVKQVLAMHAIASKLSAPPKTTKAPAPITPNSGSASPERGYRPDMSKDEYRAWREKQTAKAGDR